MPGARTRNDPVVLGVITRPHGLRGEVRVRRFNPSSTLLLEVRRVHLWGPDGRRCELSVRSARRSGDADVLGFEGVGSIEAAQALRGAEVAVDRALLPPLAEGEHYHVDLVGMRVFERGVEVGQVLDVLAYPTVDALRIARSGGGAVEVPILEPYVLAIDPEAGRIDVAYLEDFEAET